MLFENPSDSADSDGFSETVFPRTQIGLPTSCTGTGSGAGGRPRLSPGCPRPCAQHARAPAGRCASAAMMAAGRLHEGERAAVQQRACKGAGERAGSTSRAPGDRPRAASLTVKPGFAGLGEGPRWRRAARRAHGLWAPGARHLGWGLWGALGVDPAVTAPAASANVLEGASGATGNAVFPRAGAPARGLPTPGTQRQA